jgi:hypothetical protein
MAGLRAAAEAGPRGSADAAAASGTALAWDPPARERGGRMVARESLILAAREVFVLIALVAVLIWIGYVITRGSRS